MVQHYKEKKKTTHIYFNSTYLNTQIYVVLMDRDSAVHPELKI